MPIVIKNLTKGLSTWASIDFVQTQQVTPHSPRDSAELEAMETEKASRIFLDPFVFAVRNDDFEVA